MSDASRRRHIEDLRGSLAQQLSAAADEWAPVRHHPVREPAHDPEDRVSDALSEKINGQELRMDDAVAMVRRSFDYEAAEWLLKCVAVTVVPRTH